MPSGYTENLKLALFNSNEDGWASAMNKNIKQLDSALASSLSQTKNKIIEIEGQIANRYADLETSLRTQTQSYIDNINAAQQDTYTQLTAYFESVIQPTLETFLTDINNLTDQIQAQITSSEATRQSTLAAITAMQNEISSQFTTISETIAEEAAIVSTKKTELETLISNVQNILTTHTNNADNPHSVSSDDINLSESIKYQENSNDAAFL